MGLGQIVLSAPDLVVHQQVHRHFGLRGVRPFSGLNINRSIVNVSTLRRRNAAVTCVSRADGLPTQEPGSLLYCHPVLKANNLKAKGHATGVAQWLSGCRSALFQAHIPSLLAIGLLSTQPAHAVDVPQLFNNTCAGCHARGGNVQGGPTLFLSDLEKNQLVDPAAIYQVIYSGKGKMPGYGIDCTPKGRCTFAARLSDEQIDGLSNYVLQQAKLVGSDV